MSRTSFLLIAALSITLTFCTKKKKSVIVWDKNIFRIGSQSSPRAADLNQDGILDIVMGAGLNEYQASDHGVIAIDGETGELLWKQHAPDQMYGSATLYDVTGDGISDVFIGGRSPHFKALNGRTGDIIWEYKFEHAGDSILKHARFNFNNSVLVPDQNGDGFQELMTVNGGNSKADPYSEVNRFPAVLMIFDSRTGNVLAADTMPDGGESYMSPLIFRHKDEQEHTIVFGTGGETIAGSLYVAKLSGLMAGRLSAAKVIATETGHGFIAPPSLADITRDGHLDIIAISHGSTAIAVDGKSHEIIWKHSIPETECSNSFAVGNFTDDDVPDFFTFVSKGMWPNSAGTQQVMIDGHTGKIAFLDSLGCTGFSSPVVFDLNNDGYDEAFISVNHYDCSLGFAGKAPDTIESRLVSINFKEHTVTPIDVTPGFKNVFTTPWLGDLDSDGYLDIVHCQYYHYGDMLSFLGMRVKRIDTGYELERPILWGSYMGANGDGIYSN